MSGTNNSTNNNTCVVCYKTFNIYSIGVCEHSVCYECSTRMRVLCSQNECPICRQDLPKVVFTKELKPFDSLNKGDLLDTQYDIYFDSIDIQEKFKELLANTCSICKEKPVFNDFACLKTHMVHQHQLFYCNLCVDNLKIFSRERRCYTRSDLALHRRKGDIDDRSHKGHPLCEFCDLRYMDNDDLYRHLRRDHLYCHFCDAEGLHQYYSSYEHLRNHFSKEHYLCEEGMCVEEKFTSAFRTEIDLKAHKATVHGRQMSKAAAKQARTLELEFTLTPRSENRLNRRGIVRDCTVASTSRRDFFDGPAEEYCSTPRLDVQDTSAFPTLGNATGPTLAGQTKTGGNVTIRSFLRSQPLAVTDENFPALNTESTGPNISKTVNFSVSGPSTSQKSSTSNVSIQVNHEGTVTTRVTAPNIRIRPRHSEFPALSSSEPSTSTANPVQWKEVLKWTCSKSTPTNISKSKVPSSPSSSSLPMGSAEDFPILSKSKKQSVITMVPSYAANSNNSQTMADLTKGKAKKKKVKPILNDNSSSGNETGNSKLPTRTTVIKKDIKSTHNSNDATASKKSTQTAYKTDNGTNSNNISKSLHIQNSKEAEHTNKKDKKKNKNAGGSSCVSYDTVNTKFGGNTNNEVHKKRSELKINNLNTTNNNIHQTEDFPALCSSGTRPPGFTNPPPGFELSIPAPPPGFSIKHNSMERLHDNNGLTFTNSSGESYSILPDNNKQNHHVYSYVPPPDFQKRNKCLVARFNEVLDHQDQIEEFRRVSGHFREGSCDAEKYYIHCRQVMGTTVFGNIFPELLVLLPDIVKQQELFKIYKNELGGETKGLEMCSTCGQILKNGSDFRMHISSHTLENHFPALGKSNAPPLKNTWVRK